MNTSFDHNLFGIDHNTTVNICYFRDVQMNLNNNETIIQALKKLGYYNFDYNSELIKYQMDNLILKIKNELGNDWNSLIRNKTLNEIIGNEPNELLDRKLERSIFLSQFLSKNDTYDFYNSLTLDELGYLGY
jgi:hypothetical protein